MPLAHITRPASQINNKSVKRLVAKTIYVDSINGNNINSGASQALPVQTLSKANELLINNTIVYLKKGQTYRGTIFVDFVNGCIIDSYGTGKHPILEGTEPINKANFTLTNGQTKTYQVSWSFPDSLVTNCSEFGARVWETNVGIEKVLIKKTSIEDVESSPGSYFSDLGNNTVYVHPTDSTNPVTNSFTYDACAHAGGIQGLSNSSNGTRDNIVRNIRVRRPGANNGGIVLSQECSILNCAVEWGGKHHVLLGSGTIDTLYCYKGDEAINPIVFFESKAFVGGTKSLKCRNIKIIDVGDSPGGVIYCHLLTGERYETTQFDDCVISRNGKTTGFHWGSLFESKEIIFNNCLSIGGQAAVGLDSNPDKIVMNGCEIIGADRGIQRNAVYTPVQQFIFNNGAIKDCGFAFYIVGQMDLEVTNSVFQNTTPFTFPNHFNKSYSVNKSILRGRQNEFVYDFWTQQIDGTKTGDSNLYDTNGVNPDRFYRLGFDAGHSLTEWKTNYGIDLNTQIETPIKWQGNPSLRQYQLASNSLGFASGVGILNTFTQKYPGLTPVQIETTIKAEADAL
jgi:hypothetical protein